MSKHIAEIPVAHRQEPRRIEGKLNSRAAWKTCPSCGERFYANDLHGTHIVSACRVIRRRVRAAAAGAA